jgi:bifunctional N-acetylglucosamine-1-phosphate-uridyltransferase/glucosamine-1-phosphate-acetyltransferase GlmU-like protein
VEKQRTAMKSSSGSCGFAVFILTASDRIRSHVAPVTIGDGAYVATGSVITADVAADALSIARAPGRQAGPRQAAAR